VEGQAFGELTDLAGANAAEKRAVAGSRTFSGKRVRQCGAAYDGCTYDCSGFSTAAPSGVLLCEAVCAVLVVKDCPQWLLCAQL